VNEEEKPDANGLTNEHPIWRGKPFPTGGKQDNCDLRRYLTSVTSARCLSASPPAATEATRVLSAWPARTCQSSLICRGDAVAVGGQDDVGDGQHRRANGAAAEGESVASALRVRC